MVKVWVTNTGERTDTKFLNWRKELLSENMFYSAVCKFCWFRGKFVNSCAWKLLLLVVEDAMETCSSNLLLDEFDISCLSFYVAPCDESGMLKFKKIPRRSKAHCDEKDKLNYSWFHPAREQHKTCKHPQLHLKI